MGSRLRWGVLAAAACLAVAAGCGSGGDKAGGGSSQNPIVLTLESENVPQQTGAPEFAAAVGRLSAGSLRVDLVPAERGNDVDYERGVVDDVRSGKVQLGIVGVRVWDTLGVTSFRALLVPLLVDSLELQGRVLASTLSARMLDGVEKAGVVGIALLPGPLRLPYGFTRPFVGPDDYRGASFGFVPGRVAATALESLGARGATYPPGELTGLDGAELDPATIVYNGVEQRRGWLTANVVLWPKPFSIVMNKRAFAALTEEQQELLRRAGREAAAPELRQVARDSATALSRACAAGKLAFASASTQELAALRRAVQPLYAKLASDPETKRALDEIADLRRGGPRMPPAPADCPRAGGAASSPASLEGTWKLDRGTEQELIDAGIDPVNAAALARLPGTPALVFDHGRHRGLDLETGKVLSTGTYEVDGDVVRLVFASGVAVQLGRVYSLRWSVYRDSLRFEAVPGSEPLIALVLRPWSRVR
jgi:TRAP-type C4-dicarboxylate transport system substrate-binding protein